MAGHKNIGILLSLKDQFTKPLQKATESTKGMNKVLKNAERQMKRFSNAVKKGFKTAAKYAAIGLGALTAATGLFVKQSIDAAKDKMKADKLLETNMKRTKIFSEQRFQDIKKEASALQDLGVVGDDVSVAGAAQLAMYKLNYEQIKKTMPVLSDMIAKEKGVNGTQEDAIAMADLIGKALNGKVKGLQQYGVQLSAAEEKLFKTMKAEQRLNFIVNKVNKSIGGTAKAIRETDEGKIAAMKGYWGDMQAELGKKLLPYLGKFADWFSSKIPQIQDYILGLADKTSQLIEKVAPYMEQFKNLIGSLWDKASPAIQEFSSLLLKGAGKAIEIAQIIINNWDRLSPAIYTVVGAMTAYKIVMFTSSLYTYAVIKATKIKTALDVILAGKIGLVAKAQAILNAAMKANPIGLVIGAIAALVGIGWMLYRNWDIVKKKVTEFWDKLDNNPIGRVIKLFLKFGNPIGGVINLFIMLKEVISENWDKIVDTFKSVIDKITHPIETVKNAFSGLIDKFKIWNNAEVKDKNLNISENKTTTNTLKTVGRKALGTSYFKGGLTGINEGGRTETAILPSGTKILSHEQGKNIANKNSQKVEVHIHIAGNFIGEREHMEKYAKYTGERILATLSNI